MNYKLVFVKSAIVAIIGVLMCAYMLTSCSAPSHAYYHKKPCSKGKLQCDLIAK